MKRFWFEFELGNRGIPFNAAFGCGVTAPSYEDAIDLMCTKVFKGPIPKIKNVVEVVDVSKQNAKPILSEGAPPASSIWFPPGYD